MSLTRSAAVELCSFINDNCNVLFGAKFWDCRLVCAVDYGTKPEKYETRIFALSKFRIFILSGKTTVSLKIDRCFHLLSIRSINILSETELCLCLDENTSGKRRIVVRSDIPSKEVTLHILTAIKHYFPDSTEGIQSMIELVPAELYSVYETLPHSRPFLACHNFRRSYAALCDYYEQPFREEVVWDMEKIYASHSLRILRLEDFTHLLPRDLIPILAVCQYSAYFTGISVDSTKLSADLIDVILSAVRRSTSFTSIGLRNCSLTRDFIGQFAAAILANPSTAFESIDLSKNLIDDKKGISLLCTALSKMPTLRSLCLSECALSEKSINHLSSGLMQGLKPNGGSSCLQLVSVDLSGNSLKDDASELLQLLSLSTMLCHLDLSDTGLNIDKLWPSLKFGGLQIEELLLSGCQAGKRSKDGIQTMKEYFSSVVALKHIDLSNTTLSPDFLKAMLLGLASNKQLSPIKLTLNGVCDRSSAPILETCLPGMAVSSLSLRDNGLESDLLPIIISMSNISCLSRLDLSGANFVNLRRSTKHVGALTNILLELVKLIGEDDSHLRELILADCRLGSHLSVVLNTIGVSASLQVLDITGNEMGNFGARLLAKALQINTSLKSLSIDRNQIAGDGFADIAQALQLNTTITSIPYPVVDVSESLNRPDRAKTLSALSEIEALLELNRLGAVRPNKYYERSLSSLQRELEFRCRRSAQFESLSSQLLEAVQHASSAQTAEVDKFIKETMNQLESVAARAAEASLAQLKEVSQRGGADLRCSLGPAFRSEIENIISAYLSDLKWKRICNTVENLVNDIHSMQCGEEQRIQENRPCSQNNSPLAHLIPLSGIQRIHRPKSVVTDLSNENEEKEGSATFDAPPVPSALIHLNKSRPRRLHNISKATKPSLATVNESSAIITSTTSETMSEDSSVVYDVIADEPSPATSETSSVRNSVSETSLAPPIVPGHRNLNLLASPKAALKPPSSSPVQISSSAQSVTPLTISTTPPQHPNPSQFSPTPPILPRRSKIGINQTPPTLPPKPDTSLTGNRPSSCAVDDVNSNRKSVADMARMFSSSDSPLARRS
ncbi:hypothetical protein AB6A40_000598 [Gnathostoma spinigerum]|uniref:CARMIL pleckstrin homology domain-containing protein n=1 Tax=Gnathostoma spinigerum TaxID=75299 RepID=A0ABD6E2F3_9BILA